MQTVGQIIRKRREALGLSLAAVASAVGVAKSYLSMIENHRVDNPPSRGLLLEGLRAGTRRRRRASCCGRPTGRRRPRRCGKSCNG